MHEIQKRQNYFTLIDFRTVIGRDTGKEIKELSEVTEMLDILITVWIIQVYAFFEMHWTLRLRSMHLIFIKYISIKRKWKGWYKYFHENGNKHDIFPRKWGRSSIFNRSWIVLSEINVGMADFVYRNLYEPSRFILWCPIIIRPRDVFWTLSIILKQCF